MQVELRTRAEELVNSVLKVKRCSSAAKLKTITTNVFVDEANRMPQFPGTCKVSSRFPCEAAQCKRGDIEADTHSLKHASATDDSLRRTRPEFACSHPRIPLARPLQDPREAPPPVQ